MSITKLPQLDLYEVVGNGNRIFYTDAKGEFALMGNLIDLKTRVNLTQQRQDQLNVVDFSRLPLDKAFVKVKGDGSRKIAIFTDPDCPYCKRLEQELAKVSNVTVYVFLYPLPQLHPDAPRKARAVWCACGPGASLGRVDAGRQGAVRARAGMQGPDRRSGKGGRRRSASGAHPAWSSPTARWCRGRSAPSRSSSI